MMPDQRGVHWAAVKLMAITGWGQENDKVRAFSAGFNHHLTKPVELQNLLELIQSEILPRELS